MNLNRHTRHCALAAIALSLAACGGGGGDSAPVASAPIAPPSSGSYAWVLKAQGPTNALKYGLSLLHPSTPGTEWRIELASSVVSDARLVVGGTIDAAGLRASALKPYALLYIVGGDVRRVPMDANGTAPVLRVQRAQSTSACAFLVEADDYAAPENSRYIISTAGADGQCGTADDGRAEVKFAANGGVSLTPIVGDAPLGAFRDVATLAPRGWIYPKAASFWNSGSSVTTRAGTDPAFGGLVASTYRAALLDDGMQLSLLDFPAGNAPVETRLSSVATGGGGWCNIGFDADSHYVYRNTAGSIAQACGVQPSAATTWTILKITRVNPTAAVLSAGNGFVSVASMGSTKIYATVIGASDNSLVRIDKIAGGAATAVQSTPSTTLITVQTSANSVHQLWRVTNIGTVASTYAIEMIDETGATLYTTSAGGFPLAVADASVVNFNASESRTRFVLADGYGAELFSGASLVGYDTAARTATTFGSLPGSADFGTDFVFASVMGGPDSFMTGFAARSANAAIQEAGAKVFSFDASTGGSLKYTSSVQ